MGCIYFWERLKIAPSKTLAKVRNGEWLCENVLVSNFNRIIYLSCENIGVLGIIIPILLQNFARRRFHTATGLN